MLEKWLLILLMGAAFGGASFVAGMLYTEKEDAEDRVQVVIREKEVIKYVAKKDNEQARKFEEERSALRSELDGLRREYDGLREVLDKRDGICDLPPGILRVLNSARAAGRSPADPGKPDAAVRPAAAPAGWASRLRGLGDDR